MSLNTGKNDSFGGGEMRGFYNPKVCWQSQAASFWLVRQMLKELLIAFGIVGICLVIHLTGIMILSDWLLGERGIIDRATSMAHRFLMLMIVFSVFIVLHLASALI